MYSWKYPIYSWRCENEGQERRKAKFIDLGIFYLEIIIKSMETEEISKRRYREKEEDTGLTCGGYIKS